LSALLGPLVWILAFAVIGFLLRGRRPLASHISFATAFLLLYLLSTPFVSSALLDGLQWYPAIPVSETTEPQGEAIVVLAAGRRRNSPEYGGDTVDAITLERIRYAAHLKRKTGAPLLVSGGAFRNDNGPLARLMADTLKNDFEIEVDWLESRSQNTEENARFSAEILDQRDISRVYLVTHAWHMPRAKFAFEHHGIVVIPGPTGFVSRGKGQILSDWLPRANALAGSSFAIHEWLGLAWYWFRLDRLDEGSP